MNVSKWIGTGIALHAALVAGAAAAPSVALDIGHFLEKPGATSARGREEFSFNRELALEIERALKQHGLRTQLIGADGAQIRLGARATQGRGADFFLSVHHDSVQPHFLQTWEHAGEARNFSDRYAGFSLFVSRRNPAPGASLACASALGEALRRAGFQPSLYHADPIAGESKPFADRANGVHYYDNLVVLKSAASPAVLFEAGVIVNRDEELVLGQAGTRERIAVAVAAGLGGCLDAKGTKRER